VTLLAGVLLIGAVLCIGVTIAAGRRAATVTDNDRRELGSVAMTSGFRFDRASHSRLARRRGAAVP
jgi:hypothetical protein